MKRCPPAHSNFLHFSPRLLEKLECVKFNPSSLFLIVPIPKLDDSGMTGETRYSNSHIMPVAVILPILESVLQFHSGAKILSIPNSLNGFW